MAKLLLQYFQSFNQSGSNAAVPSMYWPGGDGWMIVSGTFGGGAQIKNLSISDPSLSITGTVPNFGPVSAAGTYSFSAPAGLMTFVIPMSSGDSVSGLTVSVIPVRAE